MEIAGIAISGEFLGSVLVGIAGAGLTFWLGRRAASGQVETSEAEDLWEAQMDFANRLQDELSLEREETKYWRRKYSECMQKHHDEPEV